MDAGERPLPRVGGAGDWFWRGGAQGELLLGYCQPCAQWLHPSREFCPQCLGPVAPRAASGRGHVVALSRNEQAWPVAMKPPYVVAIVAVAESPDVRLTTNLAGPDADQMPIGSAVRVRFEPQGDIWLPLFVRDVEADSAPPDLTGAPALPAMPPVRRDRPEDRVVISGVGASAMGRRLPQSDLALTLDACRAAIADAGLSVSDIDGVCAYPGSDGMPGLSRGGVRGLEQALGLQPIWHAGGNEAPGQIGAVMAGMLAVASGLCRHVLCFTNFRAQAPAPVLANDGRVDGEASWFLPYGCASPANWLALYASHYCARYAVDPLFLGNVVAASRAHAARNPLALHRGAFDLAEYRGSRIISTPLRLADCDMPCDGAKAVIVSAVETAADLRVPPVRVMAMGARMAEPQSWDQGTLSHQPQVFGAAAHMWSRTDLHPDNVDVALLYDGFTFNLVSWIEAMGFCGMGEGAAFIGDGARIGPGGALPVNTDGGHLSAGRSNGYGQLLEAVRQLRGEAEGRHVIDARVAVVSGGGAIPAGCLLLHKW